MKDVHQMGTITRQTQLRNSGIFVGLLFLIISWQCRHVRVVQSFSLREPSTIHFPTRNDGVIEYPEYGRKVKVSTTTLSLSTEKTSPQDSDEELASIESWRSTSSKAADAKIVYTAPSSLHVNATLQIKQRTDGWHTIGIVGGPTKSIYHGVFRKDDVTGRVDPFALGPSEYTRTMVSVALTLSTITSTKQDDQLRFLHMGYGSGSLQRLLKTIIPNSYHESIDIDPVVADAAFTLGLIDPHERNERLLVGDALRYGMEKQEAGTFHGICIDVFDGENLMPSGFCSVPFLKRMRDTILRPSDQKMNGKGEGICFIIHNFHVGNEKLTRQLEEGLRSYTKVFGANNVYTVDSLNNNKSGGNTILVATCRCHDNDLNETKTSSETFNLCELATVANLEWRKARFDIASRMKHVRCAENLIMLQ